MIAPRYTAICADGPYRGSRMSSADTVLLAYVPRLTHLSARFPDEYALPMPSFNRDYAEYRLERIAKGNRFYRDVTNWWVYGDVDKIDLNNLPNDLPPVDADFQGYLRDEILPTRGCSERNCTDKEVEWVHGRERYLCEYHRDYLNNLDARVEKVRKSIGPEFAATFTRTTA